MSNPTSQARRVDKINGVIVAVKTNKWTSFNEFIYHFYASDDPNISRQAFLFIRNRATDAFQVIMGVFLASATDNSSRTTENYLKTLSENAKERARKFVLSSTRLFGTVYDNINLTLHKASQRLDSGTEQLNTSTRSSRA
ncbi:hypothetical protein LXA43DRAFT_1068557 [Ganoderma leucocontextum]|nr:hypothetical protein LXA43DRAFT_1068557 [Ganoderma leucocontextum]